MCGCVGVEGTRACRPLEKLGFRGPKVKCFHALSFMLGTGGAGERGGWGRGRTCILPRPKVPRSPPRLALEQSDLADAILAKSSWVLMPVRRDCRMAVADVWCLSDRERGSEKQDRRKRRGI